MNSRRNFMMSMGTLVAAAPYTGGALAAKKRCDGFKRGTPDNGLRSLTSGSIDEGLRADWDVSDAIHRNFRRIIEQNFRIRDSAGAMSVISSLSDRELHLLATNYLSAATDGSGSSRLLEILAARLDEAALGRLSAHFGFNPVYLAAHAVSPTKAQQALPYLRRDMAEPSRAMGGMSIRSVYENPLDYTLKEIYLNYRTAPIGSMSVSAAMYETAMYAGVRLTGAFGAGYTLGSFVQSTWASYSPQSWMQFSDFLGSNVDAFVGNVQGILGSISWSNATAAMRESVGTLQQMMWGQFNRPAYRSAFEEAGGDYNVTKAWREIWRLDSCK